MSGWNHSQKKRCRPGNRLWLRELLCSFVWLLCLSVSARAATYAVDRTDDNASATACTADANDCSLRGAIIKANADAVQDTIALQANQTYTLTLGPADSTVGAIVETSGDLDVTAPLVINGNGATINGGGIDRVFSIQRNPESTFTATFNNLVIKGGMAQGLFSFGGGINVRAATLNLNSCIVTANTTSEAGVADNGGGIAVNGLPAPAIKGGLNLVDCTVSGNSGYNGGGIVAGSSNVTITRSTIAGNSAAGTTGGGGIFVCGSNSSVQIYNSTISGNTSASDGGGVSVFEGVVAVSSSTIAFNNATRNGGGISRLAGTAAVGSSIVAANVGTMPDVSGTFSTSGYNVIGKADGSIGFAAGTDRKGTIAAPLDPLLGPLQINGGTTATHALLSGSPAVNAGSTSFTTDQRGTARPQGTADDSGAYELETALIYNISGHIADANGTAISGVTVTGGPGSPPAVTNANGDYTLTNAVSGTQTITPSKADYTFTPVSRSVTVGNASVGGQNFVGKTGIYVSGRIATSASMAINGVTVTRTGPSSPASPNTVTTNSAGYYTFIGVQPGSIAITPTMAGYNFTPATKTVLAAAADISNINFIGAPGHNLSGRIADSGGIGQQGVTVSRSGPSSAVSPNTATTNSAGYYTFTNVPDGSITITPIAAGFSFAPETRTVAMAGSDISGQNFTMAPGYDIIGRIATSGGIGIAGVTVTRNGSATTAITNSAGYFTFYDVGNGTYTLTPNLSGYSFTPVNKSVTVSGANVSGQNFVGSSP